MKQKPAAAGSKAGAATVTGAGAATATATVDWEPQEIGAIFVAIVIVGSGEWS